MGRPQERIHRDSIDWTRNQNGDFDKRNGRWERSARPPEEGDPQTAHHWAAHSVDRHGRRLRVAARVAAGHRAAVQRPRRAHEPGGARAGINEIIDETLGLGPIDPLLRDPTVTDILINGPRTVYVERRGRLERTPVVFHDEQHVLEIVQRIASRVGRRLDESSPMVDARFPTAVASTR